MCVCLCVCVCVVVVVVVVVDNDDDAVVASSACERNERCPAGQNPSGKKAK